MTDNDREISLRDVIIQLREWINYLFSKWLIIVISGVLGGALGLLIACLSKPSYSASVSFVLSTNSSSGGSLLGLATQFGIDLSGADNDVFSGDNIVGLMKSRRMVQEALLKTPNGSDQSLVNLFARETKLDEGWSKNPRTKGAYPFPSDTTRMTLVQDSLFRDVYTTISENMLDVSKPDKKQSIYAVTTTSSNEIFSYYLTKFLVDVTSSFYIKTKTKNAKDNLTMIQHEADSLKRLLGVAITLTASETDKTYNLNPAFQVQRSTATQSQVSASALGEAYGEVLKNLEIAKISLQKETPLYQIIDEPTLPLLQKKLSKLLSLILGGFLAGFLVCIFLIARKLMLTIQ